MDCDTFVLAVTDMKYELIWRIQNGFPSAGVDRETKEFLERQSVDLIINLERAKKGALDDQTYDLPAGLKEKYRELMAVAGDERWLVNLRMLLMYGYAKLVKVSKAEADEEDRCGICIRKFAANVVATVLHCGHRYHQDCIMEWLKRNMSCPSCRRTIP